MQYSKYQRFILFLATALFSEDPNTIVHRNKRQITRPQTTPPFVRKR
ncbi:hypothetical protein VAEU17_220081 [Vibrio aestuarianus]|nr:hypothetical protein VAEU17_220081 [Vibrio aestuarianus]